MFEIGKCYIKHYNNSPHMERYTAQVIRLLNGIDKNAIKHYWSHYFVNDHVILILNKYPLMNRPQVVEYQILFEGDVAMFSINRADFIHWKELK